MPPRRVNHRNETPAVDPDLAAAVQQGVRALIRELTTKIAVSMNNANNANNPNNVNRRYERSDNNRNRGNGGVAPATIHVWLEMFQKQKPLTFNLAPTPVEAENWIAHIEKIFEVLGCDDQFKARLATYKLKDGETSTEFMTRFVRLAGFLGAKAGTPEEQARNFKWALNDARDKLVNMEFSNVAEVANAARNIEILQKEIQYAVFIS
ncbi:hypothetical protein Tco_0174486 [Tanacetum coccineum]